MENGMMDKFTKAMKYVRSHADDVDAYMQLAEEAAELAAIAAKMARYLKGTSPCPVPPDVLADRVAEETGDTLVCLLVCHLIELPGKVPSTVENWMKYKMSRWANRLSEEEEKWWKEQQVDTGGV